MAAGIGLWCRILTFLQDELTEVSEDGYHLMLLQHSETFQVRILDDRNNDVQMKLSAHATEADALDEARQKVDSIAGQCRL